MANEDKLRDYLKRVMADLHVTRCPTSAAGQRALERERIPYAQAERADRGASVAVNGDRVIVLNARTVRFGHTDHCRCRFTLDPEPIGDDGSETVGSGHEGDVEFRDQATCLPRRGRRAADDAAVAEQDHRRNAAAAVVGAHLQMR